MAALAAVLTVLTVHTGLALRPLDARTVVRRLRVALRRLLELARRRAHTRRAENQRVANGPAALRAIRPESCDSYRPRVDAGLGCER